MHRKTINVNKNVGSHATGDLGVGRQKHGDKEMGNVSFLLPLDVIDAAFARQVIFATYMVPLWEKDDCKKCTKGNFGKAWPKTRDSQEQVFSENYGVNFIRGKRGRAIWSQVNWESV